jgi:hypothetical protein
VRWAPNSAAGTACMDSRCVLSPLDMPGYFGRRNCNVNLDDLRWDRPDLDCEPQQARGIPRNLRLDETAGLVRSVGALWGRAWLVVEKSRWFWVRHKGFGGA